MTRRKFDIMETQHAAQARVQLRAQELQDDGVDPTTMGTPKPKRQKYNAKKTLGPLPMGVGEIPYDSAKEAGHAARLELERRAGDVVRWFRQIRIDIPPKPGEKRGAYVLDFLVFYVDGTVQYQDVKGMKSGAAYKEFKRKARVVREVFGIEIEEI